MRIGIGTDTHRLTPDKTLILGGVEIPSDQGLLGHSDADVLAHAIMDALLGAAALGDIGTHFPPSDDRYSGISSMVLLSEVGERLVSAGYSIVNIDSTLIAEAPKVSGYVDKMREQISARLSIDKAAVSIKATTTEGLGPEGRGEGMTATAIALVD